jgi:hypothetical protein
LAFTVENALYVALLALAAFLRFNQLGAAPLTDDEARNALSVLHFLRGQPELALPDSPAYFFFTYFSFFILQPDNATARLTAALFGSLVVLLPWLFRDWLGRGAALLTGALLAVSSGMIAASRSVDATGSATMLALFALGLSVAFWRQSAVGGHAAWVIATAIAFGVGVASGGPFFTGLLLSALTLVVASRTFLRGSFDWRADWTALSAERWRFLAALGLTVLIVSTVGLIYRSGLGALAGSWLDWLAGFSPLAAGRSFLALPVFLIAYEPLILVFGLIGLVRALRRPDAVGQMLVTFFLIAALFGLFYAGRALSDVIWLIAPLAALGAKALVEIVAARWAPEEWPLLAGLSAVLLALWGFAQINLARFALQLRFNPGLFNAPEGIPLASVIGLVFVLIALVAAVLVTYLFAVGWSGRAAALGATLVGAFALLASTINAGWGLAQTRAAEPVELWRARPTAWDVNRLVESLKTVSNFAVGQEREIEVVINLQPDEPGESAEAALAEAQTGALAWALRDFVNVRFVSGLDARVNAPVVITDAGEQDPTLGSAYVGQAFTLYRLWRPDNLLEGEQIRWLLNRAAPTESRRVVLWVRQDIQQLQTVQTP